MTIAAFAGCHAAIAGAAPTQQDGVALPTWYYAGYDRTASDQQISQVQQAGADWVAVGPQLLMPGPTSSDINVSAQTTSTDAGLVRAIGVAHGLGMHVMLRPFIDSATSGRTVINPTDRATWFANYRDWMVHYATLAQANGVEEMSIGANYEKLSGDRADWASVIAAVRAVYSGKLTYDADVYEYPNVSFWDLLDYIGIDAYFPFNVADQHSVPDLLAAWQPIVTKLSQFSATEHKQILFTEAGYRSVANAVTDPVNSSLTGAVDDAGQADDYQALLEATQNQPWFAGVFWWDWDTIGASSEATSYSAHNKPAEAVLQEYWAQDGTTSTSTATTTTNPLAAPTTTPAPASTGSGPGTSLGGPLGSGVTAAGAVDPSEPTIASSRPTVSPTHSSSTKTPKNSPTKAPKRGKTTIGGRALRRSKTSKRWQSRSPHAAARDSRG